MDSKTPTPEYDTSGYIESIKAKLPEEPDKALQLLLDEVARAEKRRRDTQAAFTRTRQDLVKVKTERDFLKEKVSPKVMADEQLDTLKYEDPDAYRVEMNRREAEAKRQLEEELQKRAQQSQVEFELEERKRILRSFAEANPDFDITSPEVQDQIPPKYIKQLETGEISFEAFLNKAKKFIQAPKKTGKDIPPVDEKKEELPGSEKPIVNNSDEKVDLVEAYNNLVF